MDYLGHKKLEKNNGIYSSIDGIQEVGGLRSLVAVRGVFAGTQENAPKPNGFGAFLCIWGTGGF